jgi:outer membrane protein TolC
MTLCPIRRLLPVALLASAPAWGWTETPEILTPEQAVALALENHPAIEASDRALDGARAESGVARSGYLPRLDLTEDWVRSTNPVFVFGSKLGQERFAMEDFALDALNRPDAFTNATTRLVLRQNVWDAGRTSLGMRAAAAGEEAAASDGLRTREEAAYGALRAFWNEVLADEMVFVALDAEKAARANRDLAGHLVDEGLAVPSDRLSAEVRLAEVEALRIRAETLQRVSRAALRQALGVTEVRRFVLEPPAVEPGAATVADEALVVEALEARSDLRALDARIRQAETGERMARFRRLPEVGFGASYEWDDDVPFGAEGDNWMVGLSVRMPLFDGLEVRSRVGQARAERQGLEAHRRGLEEGIRLEVLAAVAEVFSAEHRLEAAERALDSAGEALRIVRERYGEGMAVMVELIGAEAALTAARGNRASAAHDLALARATVDLATGRTEALLGATVEVER